MTDMAGSHPLIRVAGGQVRVHARAGSGSPAGPGRTGNAEALAAGRPDRVMPSGDRVAG